MAPVKNHWMKFYPADWRSDPRLRMCSAAARGFWMECICLMHEATPYGHLLIEGRAPTTDQLAVLAGIPSAQLPDLIRELENVGVFSRTGKGVIYSRRMTRDEKRSKTSAKNGKKGGNPTLSKQTTISAQDNQEDKPQKLEARNQILDDSSIEESLAQFWAEYPKRVGKGQARKALASALKKTSLATILTGIRRYASHVSGSESRYVRHPATWLNGEGWNDEYPTDTGKPEQRGDRKSGSILDAAARFQARRSADGGLRSSGNEGSGGAEHVGAFCGGVGNSGADGPGVGAGIAGGLDSVEIVNVEPKHG